MALEHHEERLLIELIAEFAPRSPVSARNRILAALSVMMYQNQNTNTASVAAYTGLPNQTAANAVRQLKAVGMVYHTDESNLVLTENGVRHLFTAVYPKCRKVFDRYKQFFNASRNAN